MKKDDLIALYFEGKLDAIQTARFEDLLQNDPDFQARFAFEKQVKQAIISTKKEALQTKLKGLEQPKPQSRYYILAIAASLIIALGLFALLKPTAETSNQELFAQYYQPYTNIIEPASRGNEVQNDRSLAFRLYDSEDFKTASPLFENLYNKTQEPYYLFYQGICELDLGNNQNAIVLFQSHKNYSDKLSTQTDWYLALAYLKVDKLKNAKSLLQNIIAQKSFKYRDAEAILEKLK